VRVHGVALSLAMVAQLKTRQGAADIDVTIGDLATGREVQSRLPAA